MEAVGLAASILGIADIVGRSVIKLHDIRSKLKQADLTLTSLIGELTATKAALNGLRSAVSTAAGADSSDELLMDLDASLTACQLLVSVIDERIPDCKQVAAGSLSNKVQVLLADRDTKEHLQQLSRTVQAINIVRDCMQQSDRIQLELLHSPENRSVLDEQANTASLDVLWDKASFSARNAALSTSQQLSARSSASTLSLRFPGLDETLLSHKSYRSTLDSVVGDARARHEPTLLRDPEVLQKYGPWVSLKSFEGFSRPHGDGSVVLTDDVELSNYLLSAFDLVFGDKKAEETNNIRKCIIERSRGCHSEVLRQLRERLSLTAEEETAASFVLRSELAPEEAWRSCAQQLRGLDRFQDWSDLEGGRDQHLLLHPGPEGKPLLLPSVPTSSPISLSQRYDNRLAVRLAAALSSRFSPSKEDIMIATAHNSASGALRGQATIVELPTDPRRRIFTITHALESGSIFQTSKDTPVMILSDVAKGRRVRYNQPYWGRFKPFMRDRARLHRTLLLVVFDDDQIGVQGPPFRHLSPEQKSEAADIIEAHLEYISPHTRLSARAVFMTDLAAIADSIISGLEWNGRL